MCCGMEHLTWGAGPRFETLEAGWYKNMVKREWTGKEWEDEEEEDMEDEGDEKED